MDVWEIMDRREECDGRMDGREECEGRDGWEG